MGLLGSDGIAGVLQRSFGLDYRSLALYRIMLGLVIIGDLADRAHDLHNFYTDAGLYPRRLAMVYGHGFWLNPYLMNGSYLFVVIMFCVHALVGLLLCLGYRTRVMIVLAWILQASLQARNISVGHGGDIYFRCILFWSLFLPLSKVWSLDRYLKDQDGPPRRPKSWYYLGSASVAYLSQPSYLYILAYYLKTHEYWWKDHIAAYLALRLEYFSDGMPVGQFLLAHPEFLPFLTWSSLIWEGYGPLLCIPATFLTRCCSYYAPVWNGPLRFLGAIGMIALHLGFSMSLRLGTFFWITVTGQLALFPSWFWDTLIPFLRRVFPIFDRFLLCCYQLLRRGLSYVDLLRNAFTALGVRRPPPPRVARTGLARWRYIGRKAIRGLFIATMCAAALGWNVTTTYTEGAKVPERWSDSLFPLGERLGIDQNWGMFAPRPPEGDYWFVIECLDISGGTFELFREGGLFTWEPSPVSFEIPVPFIRPWYNHRWAKYWETYVDSNYVEVRPDFPHWLCQEYNARHDESEHMAEFDLWIVEHGHLLNGSTQDWGRTHMWHGQCFPKVDSAPTEGRDVGLGEEGEQRVEEGQEGQEEQASDTDGEQADGAPAEDASAEEGERNHEQPR